MGSMRGEASVHIEATPEAVYDLVSDVTRMGEWSPETFSAEWTGGAAAPAVGATFKGRNHDEKRQWMKWSGSCEVTEAERGRCFAFVRTGPGTTTWTYRFAPGAGGDGTDVTESFVTPVYRGPLAWIQPAKKREPQLVAHLQRTLERLKTVAESS